MSAGKGDKPRPMDRARFEANYESICWPGREKKAESLKDKKMCVCDHGYVQAKDQDSHVIHFEKCRVCRPEAGKASKDKPQNTQNALKNVSVVRGCNATPGGTEVRRSAEGIVETVQEGE